MLEGKYSIGKSKTIQTKYTKPNIKVAGGHRDKIEDPRTGKGKFFAKNYVQKLTRNAQAVDEYVDNNFDARKSMMLSLSFDEGAYQDLHKKQIEKAEKSESEKYGRPVKIMTSMADFNVALEYFADKLCKIYLGDNEMNLQRLKARGDKYGLDYLLWQSMSLTQFKQICSPEDMSYDFPYCHKSYKAVCIGLLTVFKNDRDISGEKIMNSRTDKKAIAIYRHELSGILKAYKLIPPDIRNLDFCNREFKKFVQRLKYYMQKQSKDFDLKYVAVPARQGKNKWDAFHYHMICNISFIPFKDLLKVWRNGGAYITAIPSDDAKEGLAGYLIKNMRTTMRSDFAGENGYLNSNGLSRNKILRSWIDGEEQERYWEIMVKLEGKYKKFLYQTENEHAGTFTYFEYKVRSDLLLE